MQKKFSYPIKISELKQNDYKYVLNANADELEDITEILKVEKAEKFKAEIFLKLNVKKNLLLLEGKVEARLKLKSVVSLRDFYQDFDVPFSLVFDTKATYKDLREMDKGIDSEVPDILINGEINLADIALEQIALNIDDYPRAKGETFDFSRYARVEDFEEEVKENPFKVLEKLKK